MTVATWIWGSKYGPEYLERFKAGVERNLRRPHRILVFQPEDKALTEVPGCFARLQAFDPAFQAKHGLGRVLYCDLDLIFTGALDALFEGEEPFAILQGINASNPCPYNGSVWRLDAGYRPDVWSEFSLEAAGAVPHDRFPDDQAWFAARLPDAGSFGPETGVYAFQKPGWPKGQALPPDARVVAFPGWRDPIGFTHLPWVRQHWLAA